VCVSACVTQLDVQSTSHSSN